MGERIPHMVAEVFEFGLNLPATIATFRAGRPGHEETTSEATAPLCVCLRGRSLFRFVSCDCGGKTGVAN